MPAKKKTPLQTRGRKKRGKVVYKFDIGDPVIIDTNIHSPNARYITGRISSKVEGESKIPLYCVEYKFDGIPYNTPIGEIFLKRPTKKRLKELIRRYEEIILGLKDVIEEL